MERRDFLARGFGAVVVAGALPIATRAELAQRRAQPHIRFGYAAITWGGDDRKAMDEISEVGYRGIQLRGSAVVEYGDNPAALRDMLAERGLTLVALSSGIVRIDPMFEQEDLDLHVRNARFLRAAGGHYLQVVDERPAGREIVAEDYHRMGRLLTNIGRRTAELGITLGYHNHMGNLGQAPEEVARVLEAADPDYVKLELDTGHYQQAGGNPADAIRRYADRLLFLHVKDVESPAPGGGPESYRFVELGRGTVDFPAVFRALESVRFEGWAIIELDSVPGPGGSPRESAEIAKRYIEDTLGREIGA
jgi:inosose dehydratase